MIKKPQTEKNALWKQRYRVKELRRPQIARRMPSRGLVVSSASGTAQLYTWDVSSEKLRQLTHGQEGTFSGYLSPDGSYVYHLHDEGGSERGHYVRIPWEGGAEQDITPDMPPYSALYRCAVSEDGAMFAFTPAEANGFPLYCLDLHPDGTVGAPRELYRSPKFIDDAALSFHGEIVVVATTEYAKARQYSLLTFETATGQRIGELSDLPTGSVRAVMFSPFAGDLRLLCTTDRSGSTRPLIWHCRSGERKDLPLEEMTGDIEPLGWSFDSRRLLLRQVFRASEQLYTYDLETRTLTRLEHPHGTYANVKFGPEGQIVAGWTDESVCLPMHDGCPDSPHCPTCPKLRANKRHLPVWESKATNLLITIEALRANPAYARARQKHEQEKHPVTRSAVARRAGVSAVFLRSHQDLLQAIEEAEQRYRLAPPESTADKGKDQVIAALRRRLDEMKQQLSAKHRELRGKQREIDQLYGKLATASPLTDAELRSAFADALNRLAQQEKPAEEAN